MTKISHALSKLRVSSHRLQIEAGRWVRPRRIPVNERKCTICQVVEDEFHYVLFHFIQTQHKLFIIFTSLFGKRGITHRTLQ